MTAPRRAWPREGRRCRERHKQNEEESNGLRLPSQELSLDQVQERRRRVAVYKPSGFKAGDERKAKAVLERIENLIAAGKQVAGDGP